MDLNDRGQADGAENEEQQAPAAAPAPNSADLDLDLVSAQSKVLEDAIVAMGFSEDEAKMAIRQTGGISVELAVAWVCENRESATSGSGSGPRADSSSNNTLEDDYPEYKMVFVVNSSLPMSIGKIAAQVAHSAIELYQKITEDDNLEGPVIQWLENGSKKISLKGETTEQLISLSKKAEEKKLNYSLIQDAGLTQVPPGSRTVLAIFGEVSEVDQVTGRLKLL